MFKTASGTTSAASFPEQFEHFIVHLLYRVQTITQAVCNLFFCNNLCSVMAHVRFVPLYSIDNGGSQSETRTVAFGCNIPFCGKCQEPSTAVIQAPPYILADTQRTNSSFDQQGCTQQDLLVLMT